MSRRAPSVPPLLPGFEYVSLLGSGGFADVFLYRQRRREVAVKVLLADVRADGAARRQFEAEADLMAHLSAHPRIVTVYQAEVAPDGRPFLVMEYCPPPSLDARYKTDPFAVDEALRTGIELAGAVETMHRAGIWHRDIKPANILMTQYGGPALTDFGISVLSAEADVAQGLSVPWAPPEVVSGQVASGLSGDVYSLAATVYSLLAGRTPFEIRGGENGKRALAERIRSTPLPPLDRADVPPALEQVLATAMAKAPAARYPSALSFARALQQVQSQLRMSVTQVEVRDDSVAPDRDEIEDDGATRIRSVVTVSPNVVPAPRQPGWGTADPALTATSVPPAGSAPAAPPDVRGQLSTPVVREFRGPGIASPAVEATIHRAPAEDPVAPDIVHAAGRTPVVAVLAAVVVVLVAVGAFLALRSPPDDARGSDSSSSAPAPVDAVGSPVPAPTAVVGTLQGAQAQFTWGNPDPEDGDTYLYRIPVPGTEASYTTTSATAVTVPAATGGTTCLEVLLRRANGTSSPEPATGCVGP
ncbi:serine/threonine-protein kinase [Pengzhenrongella sicca]|uniref:non-specific serine/threonine protein kinase n=1 Tax=Pengzhenrongella sicca TaxID=2819238 RepID=A0A8A4ZAJ5_9MICO|nr:serine/threonine-protein kinase [Pengzhenrongella sicca]QTE28990.1 serine/threonine protein kinase [Pengzhenrongella sicca]